jgi:hypothetical protein
MNEVNANTSGFEVILSKLETRTHYFFLFFLFFFFWGGGKGRNASCTKIPEPSQN